MKPGEINKLQILSTLQRMFGSENVLSEHRFAAPLRQWRFDYAIPEAMLAIEYHGHAGFVGEQASGHSTIKGLTNDCEKMNVAQSMGWKVLAFTALHFRYEGRKKHKLNDIETTIMQAIARIQMEREAINNEIK